MGNLHLVVSQKQPNKPVVLTDEFCNRLAAMNAAVRLAKHLGCLIVSQDMTPDVDGMPTVKVIATEIVQKRLLEVADGNIVFADHLLKYRLTGVLLCGIRIEWEIAE